MAERYENLLRYRSLFGEKGIRKADRKRAQILQAAIDCIAQDGWNQFTFDNLTKRSGLSRSHINYYFSSQREIVTEVIRLILTIAEAYMQAALAEAPARPKARLDAYVNGLFEWLEKEPEQGRAMMLLIYISSTEESFCALASQIRDDALERIGEFLKPLASKSTTRRIRPLARSIRNLLIGDGVELLTTCKDEPREARTKRLQDMVWHLTKAQLKL